MTAVPSFADLGLPTELIRALARSGIDAPFPVQAATIPDAIAGRDLLARAQTGSGKTLGFGIFYAIAFRQEVMVPLKAPTAKAAAGAVEAAFVRADANADGKVSKDEAGKVPAIAARFGVKRISGFSGRRAAPPQMGDKLDFFRVERAEPQIAERLARWRELKAAIRKKDGRP